MEDLNEYMNPLISASWAVFGGGGVAARMMQCLLLRNNSDYNTAYLAHE
jgi:hypothetical protein